MQHRSHAASTCGKYSDPNSIVKRVVLDILMLSVETHGVFPNFTLERRASHKAPLLLLTIRS